MTQISSYKAGLDPNMSIADIKRTPLNGATTLHYFIDSLNAFGTKKKQKNTHTVVTIPN
jgi:hypothetical protein